MVINTFLNYHFVDSYLGIEVFFDKEGETE